MKVKSKAELRAEIKALGGGVLDQINARITDAEIRLYRLGNETVKLRADLEGLVQLREQLKQYVKLAG